MVTSGGLTLSTKLFYQNYIQMVAGVECCLEAKLHMPALALTYTVMDTFAWAVFGGEEKSSRRRFERWVEAWVLPQGTVGCSATELYAARCAVLHRLTSDADLTESGAARRVAYAWGTSTALSLQHALEALNAKDIVAVHIGELFAAVREAMARVIEAAEADSKLRQRLEHAADKHFASMEDETVAEFLARVHGGVAVNQLASDAV